MKVKRERIKRVLQWILNIGKKCRLEKKVRPELSNPRDENRIQTWGNAILTFISTALTILRIFRLNMTIVRKMYKIENKFYIDEWMNDGW